MIKIHLNDCNTYKYKPLEWCCRELKDNPCIDLFTDDLVNTEYDDDGSFFPRMCICYNYVDYDYDDGHSMLNNNYAIQYCPHCGQPIEISVVGEEDHAKELEILEAEREKILKEIRCTDSKKKTEELNEQRRMLDRRINYLYEFGEYNNGSND